MESFDVVVVGAGPAGLTAGMYAARRALSTLILSKDLGGQAATTPDIENYPGTDFTDGYVLMEQFRAQAEKHGATLRFEEVHDIVCREDGAFDVVTTQGQYRAAAVILAFGLTPRDLGVPGEQELKGRGVSYCATCDGPLFKGKRVVVAGGGNHALEAAEFLRRVAAETSIVYERDRFRGTASLTETILADTGVTKYLGKKIARIEGSDRVTGVVLESGEQIVVDGVFVEVGYVAKTEWLTNIITIDERRQIVTDKRCRTSRPGIFAAGDITDMDYKQVVVSAGDGARAALEAYRYIHQGEGKPIIPDWGTKNE